MSAKTLKFDNIMLNKTEFHKSNQPINLDLVNVDQIVIKSHKFSGWMHKILQKRMKKHVIRN